MKSSFYRTSLLLIPAMLFGMACVSCAPTRNISQYSQAQLSAITTREVDADMNATYRAAIDAVFDSGFTVSHSDREGGVVTATRKIDRTQERIWVYPYINDSVKITQLEKMVDKWAWDVYSYSGAGAGSDYGDDIEYDLVNGTVSTSEWYTSRVEGGSKELALQIEAD
jgi:hypothetical protein